MEGAVTGDLFFRWLAEKEFERLAGADGGVELGVAARGVGTEVNEIFGAMVGGHGFADFAHGVFLAGRSDLAGEATDRLEDIDGGVVAGGAEVARERERMM